MKPLFASLLLAAAALGAGAANFYWIGPATGGRWSEKANWSGGSPPTDSQRDHGYFTNDVSVITDTASSVSALHFLNGCHATFKGDEKLGTDVGVKAGFCSFKDGASLTLDGAYLGLSKNNGLSAGARLILANGSVFDGGKGNSRYPDNAYIEINGGATYRNFSFTGAGTNCTIRLRNGANLETAAAFNDVGTNTAIIVEGGSTLRHGRCRNGFWEGMCGVSIVVRDGSLLAIDGGFTTARTGGNKIAVCGGSTFLVSGTLYTGSGTVISNENSTIAVGGKLLMGQADRNRHIAAGEQFYFVGEEAQMVVGDAVAFNNVPEASAGATFNFAVPERGFKDAPFRLTSTRARLFGNPTALKPNGVNEKFIHIVVSPSSPALDPAYGYATLSKLLFAPAGFPNLAFFDCRVEGTGNRAEFPFTKVDGETQAADPVKVRYLVARMENGQGGKELAMRTMTESKGVAENTTVSVYGKRFTLASAVSQLAEEPLKTYAVLHVGETAETLAPVGEKAISTPGDFKMTWDGVEYVKSYWFRVALETRTAAGDVTYVEWSPLRPAATPCSMSPRSPAEVSVVQTPNAYNSWPMVQAIGDSRLVCAYSRGSRHTVNEPARGVFARVSDDDGATWSNEVCVCNSPEWGEVTVGKGLDASGAMLLWVRRQDQRGWLGGTFHDLYRTRDGLVYEKIASPALDPEPIQITDVFALPDGKLMSLWFAGDYPSSYTNDCWGVLESADNGATWRQRMVEAGLRRENWPTEPSGVHLGDGRILVIARCEGGGRQFQITSEDGGRTWRRTKTNISDVLSSTPSLILDASTGLLYNYYYQRQARFLKRRVADAAFIFDHPGDWPEPEILAKGNEVQYWDAGNANATSLRGHHFAATYTGTETKAIVVTVRVPVP